MYYNYMLQTKEKKEEQNKLFGVESIESNYQQILKIQSSILLNIKIFIQIQHFYDFSFL